MVLNVKNVSHQTINNKTYVHIQLNIEETIVFVHTLAANHRCPLVS